mmetsp:Transcript_18226/g.49037  ORF Transcript_18226/g.49037 Transcript_18226/m.49037 type:complete len:184 (-) Transcript_18226:129-680(-)|eukprot:CAMPEP_0185166126 /NCGR_PEP_ID=MMETSP1139-20130426/12047_1 /TAXON_ID=298111 /ORGANISM="Pavlova sp., Strain CCMP459" /LENGTH=183 /DNA_ID=CAMNT_0027731561 /DNA_START=10 /DNA_END=561 /DNA_ORIENTATION=+
MAGTSSQPTFAEAAAILRNNHPRDFQTCTEMIFKILKNAAPKRQDGTPHLGDAHHRSLKRNGKAFSTTVGATKGGVRFLRAAGFVDDPTGELLVLPDTADPALALRGREVLKALVREMQEANEIARAEESAIAAKRLAELKELQKKNAEAKTTVSEVERLRILREIEAERFEKARQEDPNDFR